MEPTATPQVARHELSKPLSIFLRSGVNCGGERSGKVVMYLKDGEVQIPFPRVQINADSASMSQSLANTIYGSERAA